MSRCVLLLSCVFVVVDVVGVGVDMVVGVVVMV